MALYDGNGNIINITVDNFDNVLYGKKWACVGDSVTYGVDETLNSEGERETYEYFISKRNNMTLYKDAISGSVMAVTKIHQDDPDTYEENYRQPFSLNRYKNIPLDCDYVTIWFGINDSNDVVGNTLGTIDDTENTTFYGAWNVVMKYLITNMPNAKIGIVVSFMMKDTFTQAVRDIAKKYGVKIFDIPADENIPYWHTGSSANAQMVDSEISALRRLNWWVNPSHPSREGYKYISYPFENWLRSL